MTFEPKAKKSGRVLAFLLILGGLLIFLITSFPIPYRGVAQMLAIALIVAGLFVTVRYVLCEFRYLLDEREEGGTDLIIWKIQGQKQIKVCHISLARAEACFLLTDKPDFEKKYGRTNRRFNHCRNLGKAGQYVLLYRDGDELIEIRIECDAAFANEINHRLGKGDGGISFTM